MRNNDEMAMLHEVEEAALVSMSVKDFSRLTLDDKIVKHYMVDQVTCGEDENFIKSFCLRLAQNQLKRGVFLKKDCHKVLKRLVEIRFS